MGASVTVRMKPYLVEYAKSKMGNGLFSNSEIITKIVKPFIRRMPSSYQHKQQSLTPDILEIPIPLISDLYVGDNKIYIHPSDHITIARIFEAHFNDALFSYVTDKVRYNAELKKCFIQFCDDYDISWENINYDMMKKKYYRFRKKKEKKTSFSSSFCVPNLSLVLTFLL